MTEQEILDVCTRTLRDLLDDESVVLTMSTRREEVPNWDSLNYISFIVVLEATLGVKFKIAQVESFATVGAIVTETKRLLG